MAFPSIRAQASGGVTYSTGANVTLPSGHAQGDLLIIGAAVGNSSGVNTPSGWTSLVNPTNHTNKFAIFYKTRGSTESNPVITWSGYSGCSWFSIAITTGTWSGTPVASITHGTSTTPDAPNCSPGWNGGDILWLALHSWRYNYTSSSNPTSYKLVNARTSSDSSGASFRNHRRFLNAFSENPGSITISQSGTWYAITIAVRPFMNLPKQSFCIDGSNYPIFHKNPADSNKDIPLLNACLNGTCYGDNYRAGSTTLLEDTSGLYMSNMEVYYGFEHILIALFNDDGITSHGSYQLEFYDGSNYGSIYIPFNANIIMVNIWFDADYPGGGITQYRIWTNNILTTDWTTAPRQPGADPSRIRIGLYGIYTNEEFYYEKYMEVRHV